MASRLILLLALNALLVLACISASYASECSNALKGKIEDSSELDLVVQKARQVYALSIAL